ncbi:valine--tRNA ligase [Candidatus Omnitrophota bacterium]
MQTQYEPKKTEDIRYTFWQDEGCFRAGKNPKKKPYSIVIPPPNITGILHMGHALNNTIQDVLIRYKRMRGYETLWMPGTDHAGIATQNVVERALAKEGRTKEDIGREEFLKRLWAWRDEYGSTIINQLKKLGASCDWPRTRFTMDEAYSDTVKEVFVRLYEKGLIYKGHYIINWCPRCRTALSDEEAPHKELDGWLYYIRYPVTRSPGDPSTSLRTRQVTRSPVPEYIVVATTRPETMLGDTAVAVNPKDKRYKFLKNCEVTLPVVGRKLTVIEDRIVEAGFGTGVVKVTPAHDKNDFMMGKAHGLAFVNIMHDDATLNENGCEFAGMDRFEARQALLLLLEEKGLLEKREPYRLSAGHCYRCHTIIEPRFSPQWFVKMKPLAKPAIKAVKDKKVTFYPQRWKKVYLNWMDNIQDWCISRQIWWGHRIPAYYCVECKDAGTRKSKIQSPKSQTKRSESGLEGVIVAKEKPEKCPYCGGKEIVQDTDVLDTWFSSWLWPFATFGDKEDRDYFYPTDTLVTASEILFFWVARMIMAGIEFQGEVPFKDVLIHGTVRDIRGVKMSKSLGNVIDPLDIIDKFGADALRFSLMLLVSSGQDAYLSEERFLVGRNFANKLWNATRYILSGYKPQAAGLPAACLPVRQGRQGSKLDAKNLTLADKWIVYELNTLIKDVGRYLESFRIDEACKAAYDFFWHKFCDWYLEISKIEKGVNKQVLLLAVLNTVLKLLHPVMPFITEEIWQKTQKHKDAKSIMTSRWPQKLAIKAGKKDAEEFIKLKELIASVRAFKKDLGLSERIDVVVELNDKNEAKTLEANIEWIRFVSRANIITSKKSLGPSVCTATRSSDISIAKGLIKDIQLHKDKIVKKIAELGGFIRSQEAKLGNPSFVSKAPADVVAGAKEKVAACRQERTRLEKIRWS